MTYNAQLNREKSQRQRQSVNSTSDGSGNFEFGAGTRARDKPVVSVTQRAVGKSAVAVSGGGKSKYSVLADVQEDVNATLQLLKQHITNISYGPTSTAHDKAHIKLEKGLRLNGAPKLKTWTTLGGPSPHPAQMGNINPPSQPLPNSTTSGTTSNNTTANGGMQRVGQSSHPLESQSRGHLPVTASEVLLPN